MSTEPISGLTYQEAGSLQADALQNAEVNHFSAWVQPVVISVGSNTPPAVPVAGDRYIVGTVPTGAWAGQANKLGVFRTAWAFYTAKAGNRVFITAGATHEYSGTVWATIGGETIAEPVTALTPAAGVVTINCALGDYFTLAPTANVTSIVFTNLPAANKAQTIMVRFTQDATARTVAWPASFKWAGGVAGAVSVTAAAVDVLTLTTFNQGAAWKATLAKAFS